MNHKLIVWTRCTGSILYFSRENLPTIMFFVFSVMTYFVFLALFLSSVLEGIWSYKFSGHINEFCCFAWFIFEVFVCPSCTLTLSFIYVVCLVYLCCWLLLPLLVFTSPFFLHQYISMMMFWIILPWLPLSPFIYFVNTVIISCILRKCLFFTSIFRPANDWRFPLYFENILTYHYYTPQEIRFRKRLFIDRAQMYNINRGNKNLIRKCVKSIWKSAVSRRHNLILDYFNK